MIGNADVTDVYMAQDNGAHVHCGAITTSGNLAVAGTITGDTSLTLDNTTITTAEIGVLEGVTPVQQPLVKQSFLMLVKILPASVI